MRYAVVIERGPSTYGASVPDLPGCVAVARSRKAVERLIEEAIALHVAGMRDDGLDVPEPTSRIRVVDVQVDV